jgi:hypothetical protein
VAGDFYALPFAAGAFDTVTTIRTLHHATDAAAVLHGIAEILGPGGTFVLEFANKRNLKAMARHLMHRQEWSPYELEPVEFVELNFNFHPEWMRDRLVEEGLELQRTRTVSHFRVGLLKRTLPTPLLVCLDRALQPSGEVFQVSPSVFVRATASTDRDRAPEGSLFRCVTCGEARLDVDGRDVLACRGCGATYAIRDGIYDFRAPVEA